ncbi:enolase C-terminal domain-like protein [Streptomyces alanosinicus]
MWPVERVDSEVYTVIDDLLADVVTGGSVLDVPRANEAMARAVDCLQADVTRCGGITVWLRVAALARSHGLQISGHCAPHAHTHAHAAAAVPDPRHLEWSRLRRGDVIHAEREHGR